MAEVKRGTAEQCDEGDVKLGWARCSTRLS